MTLLPPLLWHRPAITAADLEPLLAGPETVHVVNVSGGKDSDCLALLAKEKVDRSNGRCSVVFSFADTCHEHQWTYEHIERLEQSLGIRILVSRRDFSAEIERRRTRLPLQWAAAGVPQHFIDRALELLQPTGNAYLDMCLARGMFAWGGSKKKSKFCTEVLKVEATDIALVRPLLAAGKRVIHWLGVRQQESKARADESKYPRVQRVSSQLAYFRPMLFWLLETVLEVHRHFGIPLNPLYGLGFKRVGCFPCINELKSALAITTRHFAEYLDRVAEMERIVSQVNVGWRHVENFGDISTFFPPGTVPGMTRNPIEDVAIWSTTKRGGRQQDILAGFVPDREFYSCTGGTGWCEQ